MNYIYDIHLNLEEKLYDFFEWNKTIHIKKIPIIKVNTDLLHLLISNKIKIDTEYLNKIYNKTETFNSKVKLNYCSLFSDNSDVIAIQFNDNGISIKKSKLLFNEEIDVTDITYKLKESSINFKILKKDKQTFTTKKQDIDNTFVQKELRNIDLNKLNYIYFECFGKHETSKTIMLNHIKKLPINSKAYKNLYDILKLTATTKK